jgi:hypothetical protein
LLIDAVLLGASAGFSSLEDPPPKRLEKKPLTPPELEAGAGAAGALEVAAGAAAPPAIAVCGAGAVLLCPGSAGASAYEDCGTGGTSPTPASL